MQTLTRAGKRRFFKKKFFILITKTGHKIMTQKFMKNISYMINPSSCHIIYSHVQTTA